MKMSHVVVTLIVAAVVVVYGGLAFAAEGAAAPAPAAKAPAAAPKAEAKPAAKPAAAAKEDMVMGKVAVKTEKVDGKDVKMVTVDVLEAMGKDGKPMADLKGKSLKISGAKMADVEKMAGKEVHLMGTIKEGKEMDVTMAKEMTMGMHKKPAKKMEEKKPAEAKPAEKK